MCRGSSEAHPKMARLRSANGVANLIDVVFSKLLSQCRVSDLTSGFL